MEADADLARRAASGDTNAMAALLEQHLPQLRKSIAGQISGLWRAKLDEDDILQITCLEAFLSIDRFASTGRGSFLGWLRTMAMNNLRDAIEGLEAAKRPNPRRQLQGGRGEDSYIALFEYLGGTTTTPSKAAARKEAKAALLDATSKLPEEYRRVIMFYDLEDLSIDQVAAQMSRTAGAVYMLRARALERLREMLGTGSSPLPG